MGLKSRQKKRRRELRERLRVIQGVFAALNTDSGAALSKVSATRVCDFDQLIENRTKAILDAMASPANFSTSAVPEPLPMSQTAPSLDLNKELILQKAELESLKPPLLFGARDYIPVDRPKAIDPDQASDKVA